MSSGDPSTRVEMFLSGANVTLTDRCFHPLMTCWNTVGTLSGVTFRSFDYIIKKKRKRDIGPQSFDCGSLFHVDERPCCSCGSRSDRSELPLARGTGHQTIFLIKRSRKLLHKHSKVAQVNRVAEPLFCSLERRSAAPNRAPLCVGVQRPHATAQRSGILFVFFQISQPAPSLTSAF